MPPPELITVLVITFVALLISSIAGYGGSLLLVPGLVAIFGPKEGIALAALLLSWNNACKMVAYRRTLALREGWPLVLITAVGVLLGGALLIRLPDTLVYAGIVTLVAGSFAAELVRSRSTTVAATQRRAALPLMGASALLSGVSGTAGPLKGVALRSLGLPRLHHVGLASCVSLAGDALKANLFASAGLMPAVSGTVLLAALPMMPLAAWAGLQVNRRIGERAFRWVFWGVTGGYTLRMLGAWL